MATTQDPFKKGTELDIDATDSDADLVTEEAEEELEDCQAAGGKSTSDGYLILTFSNPKRANVQTAVFADVSQAGLSDSNSYLEDSEEGYVHVPDEAEVAVRVGVTEPTAAVVSSSSNNRVVQPATSRSRPLSGEHYYGEVFWVGEGEGSAPVRVVPGEAQKAEEEEEEEGGRTSVEPSPSEGKASKHMTRLAALGLGSGEPVRLSASSMSSSGRPGAGGPSGVRRRAMTVQRLSVSGRGRSSTSADLDTSLGSVIGAGGGARGRRMLRCDDCGKYYRNEYSLEHHICLQRKAVWNKGDVPSEIIEGQMIYFCPTCNKPFKWLGNLTRHSYVHTGQRFFKCEVCQKEFFSAYQVKRHMNSHTGMRYKCEVCDKPFTCKYACSWHTRQHYTYVE